jgi:hypothetical protein
MSNREYRNISESVIESNEVISFIEKMDFLWKGFELGQLWVAIIATTIGVILGVMFSLRRERLKSELSHRNLIINAIIEVLANHREFGEWHNVISNGNLQTVLNTSSAKILKLNSPPEPLTTNHVLSTFPIAPQTNAHNIFEAYRISGNIRRIHNQINNLDENIPQQQVLVVTNTIMEEYVNLAWHLRNIYLDCEEKFDQAKWSHAIENVVSSKNIGSFFE